MGILSLAGPSWLPFAGGAVVLAIAAGGIAYYGHTRFTAGAGSIRTEYREASEAAAERARELSRDRVATAERIDRETVARVRAADDAARARGADGAGLRLALADRREPGGRADAAECSAERAYSAKLADLLDTGSRLVEESSSIVDGALILIDGQRERAAAP